MSNEWLEKFRKEREEENRIKSEYKEKLRSLLNDAKKESKGDYRIGILPNLIADMFEFAEHNEKGDQDSFDNQAMNWGIEYYVNRKLKKVIPKFLALYNFCVDNKYTLDNYFEWGGGDRQVSFIPSKDKQVLYFTNQNIKFVCVMNDSRFHIREVYDDLFAPENADYGFYSLGSYGSIDCFREGLKADNGLEIAVSNLVGKYSRWSDCIEGNQYPSRIDLKNMIKFDFDSKSEAFRYGDGRDEGYVLSYNGFNGRCDVNNHHQANYIFSDLVGACEGVPKRYLTAVERDIKLDDLLDMI
jgi:hypothetical protein